MTVPFGASWRYIGSMLACEHTRLIPAPRDAVAAFISLADGIMRRERVCLVLALQRAVDRHPAAFEEYLQAFGRL